MQLWPTSSALSASSISDAAQGLSPALLPAAASMWSESTRPEHHLMSPAPSHLPIDAHAALRSGGRLVFETRDPARQAWLEWGREYSYSRSDIPDVGVVEAWCDVMDIVGDLVTFRWTYVFESDGAVLTSDSTLRFRHRDELMDSLRAAGFTVDEVRDAPDRPGREMVFVAPRLD